MASLANAQISIHPRGVTITSGKYRTSLSHHTWWSMSQSSHQHVVHLPEQKRCGCLCLALGLILRSKRKEEDSTIWNDAVQVINSQPRSVASTTSPVDSFQFKQVSDPEGLGMAFMSVFAGGNREGLQMFTTMMPWLSCIDFQAQTPTAILRGVGEATLRTAERFVHSNILHNRISRHVPQDVKIAVAVRDGGRCTKTLSDGRRCTMTHALHYDHRLIPFRLGGPQEAWNLCLLCDEHNWAKGGGLPWM